MPTIFAKIIRREIPATFLHEDDLCVVFRDIDPKAPHHVLIVPKRIVPRLAEATESDVPLLGHLLLVAGKVARELGVADSGFRIVINNGPDGGETVPHLHLHLLGGRELTWPPG